MSRDFEEDGKIERKMPMGPKIKIIILSRISKYPH